MAKKITEAQVRAYQRFRYEFRQTRATAVRASGVTYEWARLHDLALKDGSQELRPFAVADRSRAGHGPEHPVEQNRADHSHSNIASSLRLLEPVNVSELCKEARRALDDFEYFRVRYFGRRSMPWAVDGMHKLDALMISPEREYVVINVAPGTGKSTLLHDFAAWETTKRRWIRGLWGSATLQLASIATGRLRTTFGQTMRQRAKRRDLAAGYALDAEATLVGDYGRFHPIAGGVWRTDAFVVEQFDEENYDEKEPTWGAFGQNSEEIGWRANLIVWDDLVTKQIINAPVETIDKHREWLDDVAEERLEPEGLFAMVGQRLGPNDTYRYCLDKVVTDDLDFEGDDIFDADRAPMYAHIVYPAHDTKRCKGHEKGNLEQLAAARIPWSPDGSGGCLIDPYRVSWRKCVQVMRDAQKWETVYQQGDSAAQDVLVQKLWLDGGRDNRTGEEFPGCWDETRAAVEIPYDVIDDEKVPIKGLVTYMCVDPSPTRFWGILWMAYDPESKRRYVLDVHRDRMQAGQFLDTLRGQPTGLAHEWLMRSRDLQAPIRAMVVEANSAERFLLQYEHVRAWQAKYGVRILSHATHRNKADANFGVQTIANVFRSGAVRLPGLSRLDMRPLVQELTTYPMSITDDMVMAFWFGEYNLTNIVQTAAPTNFKRQMPSWMSGDAWENRGAFA